MPASMQAKFIIVMGVSGSGKSSVGRALAVELGWDFYDADDFHPPANVEKMSKGIPLDDSDRAPWLDSLHQLITSSINENKPGVLACSALKEKYRAHLTGGNESVRFVYLKGSYELILQRMSQRAEHFMGPAMLWSQFEALEEPADAFIVDISKSVGEIVREVKSAFVI